MALDLDNKTPTFNVKLEFDGIEANTPLEAVKKVLSWMEDKDGIGGYETFIYEVTDEETLDITHIDLSAGDDEGAVLPK